MTLKPRSRRQFLCTTLGSGLGVFGLSSFTRAGQGAAPEFIDVHTHPGPIWTGGRRLELTVDQLLRWMDQNNVQRACLLPQVSPEARVLLIPPDHMIAAAKAHPDRLVPFTNIDPRTRYGSVKNLMSILNAYKEQGAKGFGEHKVGLPIDHGLCMRVYEACQGVYLPVLFHMDRIRGTDKPGLPGLRRVLERFPKLPLIGHGPSFWANISGDARAAGYPDGPVKPGGAIDALMDAFPNLYADLSAGSGAGAIRRDLRFAREFLVRRADRLMFGTDHLRPGQHIAQFQLLAAIDLPGEVRQKIYRGNAIRVLRLEV